MSKMSNNYFMRNGKIVKMEAPIVSRALMVLKNTTPEKVKNEFTKFTFADSWCGYHTEATLHDVELAERQLEESYEELGYAAWCDLWSGINNDFIPAMSICGGEERPNILESGHMKYWGACSLGWSREYLRQYESVPTSELADDEIEELPKLKFKNVWEPGANLYWITYNIPLVEGFMMY